MPDVDRRAFALLDFLHEAPGNPGAWPRFMDALRDAISPDAVTLFATHPHESRPGMVAISGLGVRPIYLGDFLRVSARHPSPDELPTGADLGADTHPIEQTTLYRELLEPAGILPGPGLFVVNERTARHVQAATLVLPRKSTWAPKPQDRALLERLAPHMALARRLDVRLAERGRDTEALLSPSIIWCSASCC